MLPRIFQGDKPMVIVRLARGPQGLLADRVVARAARTVVLWGTVAPPNCAAPVKIQTKLDAARTKALRPIQRLASFEIVPLDADPHFLEAAIELLPTVDLRPRLLR